MADKSFNDTVAALFQGMDSFISSKTVVGESMTFEDGTVIIPFVDVSFGMGAGALEGNKKSAGGGMGGKISPNAVLVIQDGRTKLVNIKNQEMVNKIFDTVPDLIDKFTKSATKRAEDKAADKRMQKKAEEYLKDNK